MAKNVHICTIQSLAAGVPQQKGLKCPFCHHKGGVIMCWTGLYCGTCGFDGSWGGDLAGQVRSIREHTGLTRKEIAQRASLQPSTIKKYEWCWPSRHYYHWFINFIRHHYHEETP